MALTPKPQSNLQQAAEAVRRHQGELNNAETAYNFHTKMATSAYDEVKKHRRNLTQAQENLAKVAASPSTGAGASVTVPTTKQPATVQGR